MSKPTPRQVLDALDASPVDDEVERILGLGDEEVRKELESAGTDVKELDARADALWERVSGANTQRSASEPAAEDLAVVAPVVPMRREPARRQRLLWGLRLAAAAVALALLGTHAQAIVAYFRPPPPKEAPKEEPKKEPVSPPVVRAEQLRREARAACGARDWVTCLEKLDEANDADPAGSDTPELRALRARAIDGVRPPPGDGKSGGK